MFYVGFCEDVNRNSCCGKTSRHSESVGKRKSSERLKADRKLLLLFQKQLDPQTVHVFESQQHRVVAFCFSAVSPSPKAELGMSVMVFAFD